MIKAVSDQPSFRTLFSNGKCTAVADATADKGGTGDGFRPHELLEAALASCMNMSIRMCALRLEIPLASVETSVTLDRSCEGEACFQWTADFPHDVSPEDRKRLLAAAQTCAVHKTLLRTLTFQGP